MLHKLLSINSPLEISIFIYFIILLIIWLIKPKFIFDKDGKLKKFGTGNTKRKTILPLWLCIGLLGVIIYYISASISAKNSRDYYCNKLIKNPNIIKDIIGDKCPPLQ